MRAMETIMLIDGGTCPCCQRQKAASWKLCKACHALYGQSRTEWPPWLRFLVSEQGKYSAQHKVEREAIEPNADPEGAQCATRGNTVYLKTRPHGEMDPESGLPYAPYPDEVTNRAYRKANGIREKR